MTLEGLKRFKTPAKIQDFINSIPFNFEKEGSTNMSIARALKANRAHCFEGALIAAFALSLQGRKPLLMDLVSLDSDFDHVVALFKEGARWGAISKTNHAVLRYREPVYRDPKELAMSYFHEYFLLNGTKTLRSFSKPFDLTKFGRTWIDGQDDLLWLTEKLDSSPHTRILNPKMARGLRRADPIEIRAGEIEEWEK